MNKYNENFLIVQNAINMTCDQAFEILLGNDELLKPYAFINIDEVKSKKEADLILSHLTNHPNPTREACALMLLEMKGAEFFSGAEDVFKDAVCDINPNVCRAVIEFLKRNLSIAQNAMPLIINKIEQILNDFKIYEKEFGAFKDNKMRNRKNHAKNKKLFNLYWCLEAISEIYQSNEFDDFIIKICFTTADFLDYTIREKTAKILIKIANPPKELLQKLKNDL